MIYTDQNIGELINKTKGSLIQKDFPFSYWQKIKTDLQVHTQGKLYEKVVSVFKNEDEHATKFILETYEPITKGAIWKGIDLIGRIFKNTGFEILSNDKTLDFIETTNLKKNIIDNFIDLSISKDPNTVCVPYFENKNFGIKFIESELIETISKNSILFIDETNSEFTISNQKNKVNQNIVSETIIKNFTKKAYIFISENQYITFVKDKTKTDFEIIDFANYTSELITPYVPTGVNKSETFVYESPVQPFVPFGNIALLQHRTARSVENIYGYPRMVEVELPCEAHGCVGGQTICDISETNPQGTENCKKCNGTGSVSLQSPNRIYKRKLSAENESLNANIDPIKFFTPDIGILTHVSDAWQKSIALGEQAIYVQQNRDTGNVESAKSREKQLEQMYGWLDRISVQFYNNAEKIINLFSVLNGFDKVSIQKPISFAIMSEIESFEYLNLIVNSESPIFIKTTHVENFLKKYISSSSPIIRIVNVLKKVDIFCFYTKSDLKSLSDNGIIDDKQWRIHAYAYPLLMQMYAIEPQLLQLEDEVIIDKLNFELEKFMPKKLI